MIYDGNEDFIVVMTALLYESGMNEFILKWQHALYSLPGLKILRGITESRVVVGPVQVHS